MKLSMASRRPRQWQCPTLILKIFLNFTKINTFEDLSLNITKHQVIMPTIGHLLCNSVLMIFIDDKALSTVDVTTGSSNANSMRP